MAQQLLLHKKDGGAAAHTRASPAHKLESASGASWAKRSSTVVLERLLDVEVFFRGRFSLFENRCFLPWQAVSSGTFLALTANLKRPLQLQDWESNMPQLQMSWIEVFKDNQACLIAFSTTIVLLHEISDSAVPTVTKENFKMYRFASSGFDLFLEALYCWNTSPN